MFTKFLTLVVTLAACAAFSIESYAKFGAQSGEDKSSTIFSINAEGVCNELSKDLDVDLDTDFEPVLAELLTASYANEVAILCDNFLATPRIIHLSIRAPPFHHH